MDKVLFWLGQRGSVICVQEGAKIHKGILYGVSDGTVWVADSSPVRGCPGYRTLQDFASGRQVWIERPVRSWQEAETIIGHVHELIAEGRRYDLLTYNSEHFVTLALGLEPESKQVQGYAWVATLCVGVVAIASIQSSRR